MTLTPAIKQSVEQSVLCWLATTSDQGMPNVSPKEIFHHYGERHIIIANIASPQTVKNIQSNPQVCISFIDIFVQKGFQIKGQAQIVASHDVSFPDMERPLLQMTNGDFPFRSITAIEVQQVKAIIAPRYFLYPDTTEAEQIENAKRTYGVK